jgi:hypothetical protein
MTPLEHDKATATVSITGLALGCYNKATENYEVAFLRHDCHALTIEVKKKMPYGDDSIMSYEIVDHQHKIYIDAENAVSPQDPIYKVGENFDRKVPEGDEEDFRWVIDFENDFNGGQPVELQRPDFPVTEMYVSKPRLYGDKKKLTQDPYKLVPLGPDGKPRAGAKPEELGFFTEGIMADITCQDGGAVILRVDGPQGFQVQLPHGSGPHEITIKNICPPKAEEKKTGGGPVTADVSPKPLEPTDFRLFYLLIKGDNFDVEGPPDHGEGAVCNGSTLGGRANLFPLPA